MKKSLFLLFTTLVTLFILTLPFGLPGDIQLVHRIHSEKKEAVVNERFVDNLIEKIDRNNPEVVLIGDSMLGEAVDADVLSKKTGVNCLKIWMGGSGTAWHYLVVKNILPKCKIKPKYIGIFFRDNHLTLPQHKTTGKHKHSIDNLTDANEPILDEFAYHNQMSFIELFFKKHIPVVNKNEMIKSKIDDFIKSEISKHYFNSDKLSFDNFISSKFAISTMDKKLFNDRQIADEYSQDLYREDMEFHPEKSFLPYMIKYSEAIGSNIFFVRVKRKRDLVNGREPENLLRYMNKLRSYFKGNNIKYIDYSHNESIVESHFGQGDHLNRQEGRSHFTNLFANDLINKILNVDYYSNRK